MLLQGNYLGTLENKDIKQCIHSYNCDYLQVSRGSPSLPGLFKLMGMAS